MHMDQVALWKVRELLIRVRPAGARIPKLDLFLYSRGGDANVPWPLVSLIREFCDEFNVLVPLRAHSAATSVCLGADTIVMAPEGQLGPVDATFEMRRGSESASVSVEDVMGFIRLVKDTVGLIDQEQLASAFRELVSKLPDPLVLGKVAREVDQTRYVASALLSQRKAAKSEAEIQQVIGKITGGVVRHEHCINRREARDKIGLHVAEATPEEERLMRELLAEYESAMLMHDPLIPPCEINAQGGQEAFVDLVRVCVECQCGAWEIRERRRFWWVRAIPANVSFPISINIQLSQPIADPAQLSAAMNQLAGEVAQQACREAMRILRTYSPGSIHWEPLTMGWVWAD